MKVDKYLPALRELRGLQSKSHASRGERVLGSLFPNRGTGWPGGWSQDRLEQTLHYRNWTYVALHTICSFASGIMPNIAYVVDSPQRGVTTKAGRRGLLNLTGQGFGGSAHVGKGAAWDYANRWEPNGALGVSDGGHSWMTIGEYRSKALSVVKPHEDLEPLEGDHPLRRLLENPNPWDTYFDIEYELGMFEGLCGVSYEWLTPNQWGVPCERWCIPSHWVWPRTGGRAPDGGGAGRRLMTTQYDPGQEVGDYTRYGAKYLPFDNPDFDRLIQYYEVRPWGGMGSAGILRIPSSEVIMTRWKSPINKIDGYSKLSAIAQWIDSEESISKSRWSQFINQARPEFWVKLGPGYEDPTDDTINRIEAKFAAKIQGELNYGKPIITPPGAEITPLSFSPTEMAYFDSEEQIRDMILSTFGVPPAVVGIVKEMTYGSILATLASFCTHCINPILRMRGQTRTKHLASRWDEPGRRVKLWWDDCVPADPAQVNADLAEDRASFAVTPNEVRALRGRAAYRHGGDDPMGQGPAGISPIPMNTQDSLSELAELMAPMAEMTSLARASGGDGKEGAADGLSADEAEGAPSIRGDISDDQNDAGIEDPNGKPQKHVRQKHYPLPVPRPAGTGFNLERLAQEFLAEQQQRAARPVEIHAHTVTITAANVNGPSRRRTVKIENPDGTLSVATVTDGEAGAPADAYGVSP